MADETRTWLLGIGIVSGFLSIIAFFTYALKGRWLFFGITVIILLILGAFVLMLRFFSNISDKTKNEVVGFVDEKKALEFFEPYCKELNLITPKFLNSHYFKPTEVNAVENSIEGKDNKDAKSTPKIISTQTGIWYNTTFHRLNKNKIYLLAVDKKDINNKKIKQINNNLSNEDFKEILEGLNKFKTEQAQEMIRSEKYDDMGHKEIVFTNKTSDIPKTFGNKQVQPESEL